MAAVTSYENTLYDVFMITAIVDAHTKTIIMKLPED